MSLSHEKRAEIAYELRKEDAALRRPRPPQPPLTVDWWYCETCRKRFAEYVNGCPRCAAQGVRSGVAQDSELGKVFRAIREGAGL